MITEHFFPTSISHSFCPFHNEIKDDLINYCFKKQETIPNGVKTFNNNGKVYTTLNTYDILLDKKFERLNIWVKEQVKEYVKQTHMAVNLSLEGDAFFNIYKKYDYQEVHEHAKSIVSCIYFLKSNEKSSKVFFKSRMFDTVEYENNLFAPTGNIFFRPDAGKLLVFRGNVQHFVEQHLDDEERISLAYNFKN